MSGGWHKRQPDNGLRMIVQDAPSMPAPVYRFTIPSEIWREIDEEARGELRFRCELTEEGILYRVLDPPAPPPPTPTWATDDPSGRCDECGGLLGLGAEGDTCAECAS